MDADFVQAAARLLKRFPDISTPSLEKCPHGYHHPRPYDPSYSHSCDGCWCEGESDNQKYGWDHSSSPDEKEE